jgi:PAS domain-containing protein
MSGTKRSRDGGAGKGGDTSTMFVSEDEEDKDKRRQDRNLREQQRSQKITQQIDELREVLASANIRFKPDKYSTLVSVVDYIKQLQERSAMLDAEQKKLVDTISKTDDIVKESHLPPSACSVSNITGGADPSMRSASCNSDMYNEDELAFVRNVDYKSIFARCGMPLAVASIDGRFLDCNIEFETITGYKRDELLPSMEPVVAEAPPSMSSSNPTATSCASSAINHHPQQGRSSEEVSTNKNSASYPSEDSTPIGKSTNLSLFNLLSRDCMEHVFFALSHILKHPEGTHKVSEKEKCDYWTGIVRLNRKPGHEVCVVRSFQTQSIPFLSYYDVFADLLCALVVFPSKFKMRLNVVLVRSPEGRAKFFNCYLSPVYRSATG